MTGCHGVVKIREGVQMESGLWMMCYTGSIFMYGRVNIFSTVIQREIWRTHCTPVCRLQDVENIRGTQG
jgi:hypothetical protein